jgi:hypothetical protein
MEASWMTQLWFRPDWIFMKYIHLLRQINFDEARVKRERRFQMVREVLAGANLAVAVQKQMSHPVYVQPNASDPPDFFLHQPTPEGFSWITYVEHTTFGRHSSQINLAAQLATTKLKKTKPFLYDYILLVEMERIDVADVAAVKSLIAERGIDYKVWLMEGRMQDDDSTVRVVAMNSPFSEIVANFAAEADRFPEAPAAFRFKRAGSTVNVVPVGQPAPWPDPLA